MTRRPTIRAFALLLTGVVLLAAALPLAAASAAPRGDRGDRSDRNEREDREEREEQEQREEREEREDREVPEVEDEVDTPEPVLLCNLWDGEPYDYWKVHSLDQATADWWVANSANASIVESTTSCPGNPPVELCVPYGELVKLIVVEPWDANWYLANHAGTTKATNGSCEPAEPVTEPTPEPPASENGEKPVVTIVDDQPETPTTVPTTDGGNDATDEPTRRPRPERPERSEGDVAGSGGVVSVAQPAADDEAEPMEELAMTGVESWHLALAGLTMLGMGIVINTSRRRLAPVPGGAHARR